ncbi:intraflagellar transport protein 25 homolog [Corticium candelabrum]|uniref:intraflagellar transport protein 25 homolog n=1 Tax=Corticium candelabrum TaxID=121492 RepID=UPI002E274EBF|nr:intraflagellar transport protein 25 homolog [Corticium candelabrum]
MTYDVAHKSSGGLVVLATSSDSRHPPENIIDGDKSTFWVTTGLFPQEFVISFQSQMIVTNIQIYCFNVKKLTVERSVKAEPVDFELVCDRDLPFTEAQLQKEEITMDNVSSSHLRFSINTGHDHFVSIHSVVVQGSGLQ